MKRMLDYGGKTTCTQLSIKYDETKNFYNSGSVTLARRVAREPAVQLCSVIQATLGGGLFSMSAKMLTRMKKVLIFESYAMSWNQLSGRLTFLRFIFMPIATMMEWTCSVAGG